MAYSDQALLSADPDFLTRVAACAAVEVELDGQHPLNWSQLNVWTVAAAPGFADAYASALAGDVERPGNDPSVISDAMILSAVQAIAAAPPADDT